jgi:xanthosine utilization system XapX-like protein
MSHFLIENFIWLALGLVGLLIGLKLVAGAILHRLMEQSAAAEAARRDHPSDQDQR